jgi:hypothetical protein
MSLKGIIMNRFVLVVISSLVLVLSACGGSPNNPPGNNPPGNNPPGNNSLAGTYNGDLAEDVSGFFSLLTFTIDNAGKITGTTTAKDVGDAPAGEKGTITGTVKLASAGMTEGDITLESPSLGKFTIVAMKGFYNQGDMTLGTGTVRDENGAFLGTSGLLIAKKE